MKIKKKNLKKRTHSSKNLFKWVSSTKGSITRAALLTFNLQEQSYNLYVLRRPSVTA